MPKLFMLLLGCLPAGRNTEQHDVYFGIGDHIADILPQLQSFWPEAKDSLHLDAWREVTQVDGFNLEVSEEKKTGSAAQLFFINLGGYKRGEFDEFHYKLLVAAADKAEAVKKAKATAFYRHTGFPGAPSHIDEKYGVDVDDIFAIDDILSAPARAKYGVTLKPAHGVIVEDEIHLGYFRPSKVDSWAPRAGS
jgi:hypothetical protein